MLENFFSQFAIYVPLLLRTTIGGLFIYHGVPKLFDLKIKGYAKQLSEKGIPTSLVFAIFITIVEFFGGVFLIIGFATRWVAIAGLIKMLFKFITAKRIQITKSTLEFYILITIILICILILGAGLISVDFTYKLNF